ncbi:MAG: hypothetical protein FJ293_06730 [Planctomycetes bacterium]|nr:hypothetical protein [Planctomycetota bacterium]
MRRGIVVVALLLVLTLLWRVQTVFSTGAAAHRSEQAARELAGAILRAQFDRAGAAPSADTARSYAFLATLVAEGRIRGLEPVAGGERDLWRGGDYLFHVRLLNPLQRPILAPPADAAAEPGLGLDFELWAWPAERRATTGALFFASDAGYLLQGDNGLHAGVRARPESVDPPPSRLLESAPGGANQRWVAVAQWRPE